MLNSYELNVLHRPYEVRKIMNTNLILLVVNVGCPAPLKTANFDTVPQEILYEEYNNSLSCHKALNSLPRCRPKTACIRTHPNVSILFIYMRNKSDIFGGPKMFLVS